MRRSLRVLLVVAAFLLGRTLHAEDYVVSPGEELPTPEGGFSPGDRILFAPGAYKALMLRGVRGTAQAPIVLDSVDESSPAMFIGGDYALKLLECDHLSVGTFLFMGSEVGGIRITGTPQDPSTGIILQKGYIARPGRDQTTRDGILARWVNDLTIEAMKIDHWGRAAINVSHARNLAIRGVTMTGNVQSQFGVLLGQGITGCRIEEAVVMNASASGFQLGVDATSTETQPTRWALNDVLIGGCVTIKCPLPIAVGSVRNLLIDHATLFQPVSCAVAFRSSSAPFADATGVEFTGNLVAWEVGQLATFLCTPHHVEDLLIGTNLWWSHEMPEGAEYLGPLPGDAGKRQVFTVDPRLVERTLQPQAKDAKSFGCTAYTRGKNPAQDPDTAKSDDNP